MSAAPGLPGGPLVEVCLLAGGEAAAVLVEPPEEVYGGLDVGAHGLDLLVGHRLGLAAQPAQVEPGGEGPHDPPLGGVTQLGGGLVDPVG